MAILEHEVRSVSGVTVTGLNRRLCSRREFQAVADAGFFDGQRIELIEGEIIEMSAIGYAHSAVTEPLVRLFQDAFGDGFTVRNQAAISLGSGRKPSQPQIDVAVAVGTWRDYVARNPRPNDIRLLVEIADSSLKYDRETKSALYAAAGIPEYWIVNLIDHQLEVYRDSVDGAYSQSIIFTYDDQVAPVDVGQSIDVSDFLP